MRTTLELTMATIFTGVLRLERLKKEIASGEEEVETAQTTKAEND
jgi:hypothetical protein